MTALPGRLEPVTLEGQRVRLEPLSLDHLEGLLPVAADDEIWRWTTTVHDTRETLRAYLEAALADQAAGRALPFATILRATGQPVGSTRFGSISLPDRRLEIGWTWVGRPWWRSGVNREAKLLMLTYAFEQLGANRVEFKTDSLNERSRTAILALGATQEGILRNHMVSQGGRLRHSVYFSILPPEWPAVKARLEASWEASPDADRGTDPGSRPASAPR
ncbi:MAG TPA: GNAT family N-acetyltransferase [Candidatus Limnocylindrales bacterium]|nr:GNAT family N-acetyltransferase [Candidatus Limnocylindrales bacterium]